MNAIMHVRPGNGFQPNFVLSARADVNGENRLPLYSWALVRGAAKKINFLRDLFMKVRFLADALL